MTVPGYHVNKQKLITDKAGSVPLIHWPVTPNFGDLLSPWLFEKMTDLPIAPVHSRVAPINVLERSIEKRIGSSAKRRPHYISIGSIMSRVRDQSHVWGTGAFGTEQFGQLNKRANYYAVRGPLSRQLLLNVGVNAPEIYGDPALLTPLFFDRPESKTHKIGLVLRWSDFDWLKSETDEDVKIIDLGSDDVDKTLSDILSCEKIITSSLHGLIIADAYQIPNAFLHSKTPKGGIFKFMDYFASVKKFREPKAFDFQSQKLDTKTLSAHFDFDDREIDFRAESLLDACPFLIPAS